MPVFADLAAMRERFEERDLIQLTDEAGNNAIDAARIDRALAKADGLITGYVASRHNNVSALAGHVILADVACDLAFADLWRTEQPEHVKERRKAAIQTLKDIAAGTIKLDDGQETAPARPGQILTSGDQRHMGRSNLDGY